MNEHFGSAQAMGGRPASVAFRHSVANRRGRRGEVAVAHRPMSAPVRLVPANLTRHGLAL